MGSLIVAVVIAIAANCLASAVDPQLRFESSTESVITFEDTTLVDLVAAPPGFSSDPAETPSAASVVLQEQTSKAISGRMASRCTKSPFGGGK